MNRITTVTFNTTIKELNRADSWIPITRMEETTTSTATAGRFKTPPAMPSKGDESTESGKSIWNECRIETKVEDQLTATVAAPTAYSSTNAQPMIQASSSPTVA